MYPKEFAYYEAATVEEAVRLLEEHAMKETELLAGGHSLLPAMKSGLSSPDVLIDVGSIDELQGIHVADETLVIGAGTRYADVEDAPESTTHAPAFADAVTQVGDIQVRNRGTVGGNLAHADPASDLPGAAIAAGADVVVQGPDGERTIPIDEFFMGMYATSLGPDELLTRVEIPSVDPNGVGAYAKKANPASGYAVVGVAVRLTVEDGTVMTASVGANGVFDHGVRLEAVQETLEGTQLDEETIDAAAERATDDVDAGMVMSDPQTSSEFREQLLTVYTERAIRRVADRIPEVASD